MRLNSKGQVTIPAALRQRHGLHEGDEVDEVEEDGRLQIVRTQDAPSRGDRIVARLRGTATAALTTDEIMRLTRGD
jgi:AbrB family looped-hinge helix DNA binding protein